MKLTTRNYFSKAADTKFLSVSQYHSFNGTEAYPGCEARALAIVKRKWKFNPNTAMLVGSYVDSYFSGELTEFKKENPLVFTQKGELRAEFKKAEEVIQVAKKDKMFYRYIKGTGIQQVIVTGAIGGVPWKGKIDNVHPKLALVDLKVIGSIRNKIWSDSQKEKINFIEASGYIDQAAVYRELYRQTTGETLPFFIAAITKEDYPDKEIINIPETFMDSALLRIADRAEYIQSLKKGDLPPLECGVCDYCRAKKKLKYTISLIDL